MTNPPTPPYRLPYPIIIPKSIYTIGDPFLPNPGGCPPFTSTCQLPLAATLSVRASLHRRLHVVSEPPIDLWVRLQEPDRPPLDCLLILGFRAPEGRLSTARNESGASF